MTMTDDALVRDLAERADLAVPPMSLDPTAVLATGRRHRQRVVGARVALVAGLGVVAVAVAAGALPSSPTTPPAAVTAQLTEGLIATAANAAEIVTSRDGDVLSLTDGAGHRYTVRFDAAAGVVDASEGEIAGTQGDDGWLGGFGADADGADEGRGILQASGLKGDALLVAGYVSGPDDVRLEWSVDGAVSTLVVPAFAVPGAAGRVYVVRIDGAAADGIWPTVAVVAGTAGARADVPLTQLQERATGGSTITASVAADVQPVDTEVGPAVDLAIPAGDDWGSSGQDLTFAMRFGVSPAPEAGAADEAGLWVVTLAADGTTSMGAGGSVDEALASTQRNPIWSSGLTDHQRYVVGIRPPALADATFELVISTDGGEQRTEIPTFRVPGFDADVWFVAVTDEATHSDWSPVMVIVTMPDGSTTTWSLAGQELAGTLPTTPQG